MAAGSSTVGTVVEVMRGGLLDAWKDWATRLALETVICYGVCKTQ